MRLIRVAITITGAGAGNIAALLCAGLFFLFVPPVMANTADAVRGQKIFKVCASCHQVGPKAKNSVGPHLNRIFGRRAGSVEGKSVV